MRRTPMTVQSKTAARPSTVTTGAIAGSRKIYTSPATHPDIGVPFREIMLDPTAREDPYRAYDTSGPYTDPAQRSTLKPACRRCAATGSPGVVSPASNPAPSSPRTTAAPPATGWSRLPRRSPGLWRPARPARHAIRIRPPRDHHGGNDLRRPPRKSGPPENAGRRRRPLRRRREISALKSPPSPRPNSSATKSPAAAPSSPPTSTTRNSSRSSSAAISWSRSTPTSATPPSRPAPPKRSKNWSGRSAGAPTR